MASKPITIILNSNNSKKATLLLPVTLLDTSPKTRILHEAQNKFRSKLTRIFFLGGLELADDAPIPAPVAQVWVSKGEDYIGPPLSSASNGAPALSRVLGQKAFVSRDARAQLAAAAALPGMRLVVGMPDLHTGARFPIGCALAAEGIYPALIGSDVGCGIALYHLAPRLRRLASAPERLAAHLVGLDGPWEGDVREWLAKYGIERSSEWDAGLGTIGAGNHFAEICSVERIEDSDVAADLGIVEEAVYLLVHSGSRGLGGAILAAQTTDGPNPYLTADSPRLADFLCEHDYAVTWAVANRDLIAHRIIQCLRPTDMGDTTSTAPASEPGVGKILDITHNSVVRARFQFSDTGDVEELWLHRKGAAPADSGVFPCPGSRGDLSWLLRPIGSGQHNAHSLAHGAGRRLPRSAMHTQVTASLLAGLTTTPLGSTVVCADRALLLEERPEAYKSVQAVVEDMIDSQIAAGVAVLRPIVTYKVREGAARRE